MKDETSACPWCGAHFTAAEKRNFLKGSLKKCPLCGKNITAHRSGKRIFLIILFAAVVCVFDFFLLTQGTAILVVFFVTAIFAVVIYLFFETAAVVLNKEKQL